MNTPQGKSLAFRLPAAVLRFWSDDPDGETGLAGAEIFRLSRGRRGFHLISPGVLAITAEDGDPAIFDSAVHLGRHAAALAAGNDETIHLIVLPGELHIGDGPPAISGDRLIERSPEIFVDLPPGSVHVTGWVLRMLELPRESQKVEIAGKPSDPPPPIFAVGRRQPEVTPWRNTEILNRRIRTIARTAIAQEAQELTAASVWRIEGPLGCGKSFFAHHWLLKARAPRIWLRGEPQHRRSGPLAHQIVAQISSTTTYDPYSPLLPRFSGTQFPTWPPVVDEAGTIDNLAELLAGLAGGTEDDFWIVIDDLEQCGPEDLELVAQLTSLPEVGSAIRLLLIGRTGVDLPTDLDKLPTLDIEPFSDEEMNQFSPQLFTGLSLPTAMQDRLHETTHGCPFALEEAMIALIREQSLRRVYGGFFFAGQEGSDFSPSPRLLGHLQGEAYRLGLETPLHLLSLVESGVPAVILDEAAAKIGQTAPADWQETARASRLAVKADTPWGPGVTFTCPVFGTVFRFGIDGDAVQELRVAVGETLAEASSSGKSLWEAYRLLRGTSAATAPLLEALDSPYASRIPRPALLEILTQEIYRLRERDGDSETELQLLWKMLPLARKLGQLNEYTADLERGVELAADQPRRLLALAGLKAEMDQDAGRYQEAEATIQMALETAKGADERRQALLLIQLGRLYLYQERYDDAKKLFSRLADRLERSGIDALAASCSYYLGNIALHEGRYEDALALHEEALTRRRSHNLNRVAGNSLTATGAVYLALGNFPRALSCYREALELLEKHGSDLDRAYPLLGLGRALNRLGNYTEAARSLREAVKLREGKDDIAGEAIARLALAENNLSLGQFDKAQDEATKALFRLNQVARKTLLADAEQLLGKIQIRLRQLDSAKRHLETALEMHWEKGNQRSVAFDLTYLLQLALLREDSAEVTRLAADLEQAIGRLAQPDLEEQLHFQIYQAARWQRERGNEAVDPETHLQRSYREVFRKASHLEPELRHQFLFQIEEYREILEEGTRAGLTTDFEA